MFNIELSNTKAINESGSWNLKIWVSVYEDFDDPNIFIYRTNLENEALVVNDAPDEFITVCTPATLVEYKSSTPEEDSLFYRSDYVYVVVDTEEEANDYITKITDRVNKLVTQMSRLFTMTATTTVKDFGSITLTEDKYVPFKGNVRVTLSTGTDKVFLCKQNADIGQTFIAITSAEDIAFYPEDTPDAKGYYRTNAVDICFISSDIADEALDIIYECLQVIGS